MDFGLAKGYDPSQELIIDPLLPSRFGEVVTSTQLLTAADAEGCAYVTGLTRSD